MSFKYIGHNYRIKLHSIEKNIWQQLIAQNMK